MILLEHARPRIFVIDALALLILILTFSKALSVANAQSPLSITLTVTPLTGQAPFTPNWSYRYSGSQGRVTLSIDFGDGTVVDLTNCNNQPNTCPSHTYTVAGTYTIKISITDDTGTATDSKTVTVSESKPVPEFPYALVMLMMGLALVSIIIKVSPRSRRGDPP